MTTDKAELTPAQHRLRDARAEFARLTNEPTRPRVVEPGEQVHAVATGLTICRSTSIWGGRPSLVLERGQTITVDAEMIEASKDVHGVIGWPAVVHDPDAQARKWGQVFLAPGPAPDDLEPWVYGDATWREAREQARREAHARPTAQARADALAEMNRRFGPAPTTSTTLNSAPDASIAAANAQAARIAASGVRQVNNYTAQEPGVPR